MLDVSIRITDQDGPLGETELRVLAALTGDAKPATTTTPAPAKAAPAKKAQPAKVPPKDDKVAEQPKEENVAGEPKPAAKAAPAKAESDDDSEAQMELAVERATALINGGEADKLRGILTGLDVKRVSELEGDALAKFLAETE